MAKNTSKPAESPAPVAKPSVTKADPANPGQFMSCSAKQFGVANCQCATCGAERTNARIN